MVYKKTRNERFWEKVDKKGDDDCWEWLGAFNTGNCPIFCYTQNKMVQAHRYAYELVFGETIDRGVFANKICKNFRCVNPHHLDVQSMERRFWSFVNKNGPNGCWLWTGEDRNGYGRFSISGIGYPAHRVSYEYLVGKIPDNLFILHKCNNKLCVNPAHLSVGDASENMEDYKKFAILNGGEKGINGKKLTRTIVTEIKHRLEDGARTKMVAEEFGISESTVCDIKYGRTWSWLKG